MSLSSHKLLVSLSSFFLLLLPGALGSSFSNGACSEPPTTLALSDPPYENYFYSDCHSASQVVITSPLPDSNLTIIGPRLLVAWPAGNSGVAAFFAPQNGINGSLGISLRNSSSGTALDPIFELAQDGTGNKNATVGIKGYLEFNSSAALTVPILGSVRTIRDFTEGPSLLIPKIQSAISFDEASGAVILKRTWLDNATATSLSFTPATLQGCQSGSAVKIDRSTPNTTLKFEPGVYHFSAKFNYPQLEQLSPKQVFKPEAQNLITQSPDSADSLSFLSYSNKLLAGAWRFLTYFGRDSMISLLLLNPVLSQGNGSAIEAGIGAVIERVNRTDGSVCHEETLGDYATYLWQKQNVTSTAPQYDYKMVDTEFFLPIVMKQYFVDSAVGKSRMSTFLARKAEVDPENANLTYSELILISAKKIMQSAAPFTAPNNQTKANLIRLKEGEVVGQWRDSEFGLGGGRIPYDVNTALVPAALRAIAALSRAGFYADQPNWSTLADQYAQVWEDSTLEFFEVRVSASDARTRLANYKSASQFSGPDGSKSITSDVLYYAVALEGNNDQQVVEVLNSDDVFRHFLLNTTKQDQLTKFVNQTADHLLAEFPAGLYTSVGILVANPAYGQSPVYAKNFTNAAYHGTVIWSWNSLAMMARGLELQLDRCNSQAVPDFCKDPVVAPKTKRAYTKLWDVIEKNKQYLSNEVWSWTYSSEAEGFKFAPLGSLPPPPGVNPTESNIRQLWSLTFLAIQRNKALEQ